METAGARLDRPGAARRGFEVEPVGQALVDLCGSGTDTGRGNAVFALAELAKVEERKDGRRGCRLTWRGLAESALLEAAVAGPTRASAHPSFVVGARAPWAGMIVSGARVLHPSR
jgi:hypothetical protein